LSPALSLLHDNTPFNCIDTMKGGVVMQKRKSRGKFRLNEERFLQLLEENGWSQERFARQADLSLAMVQAVLGGRRRPGPGFILGLIRAGIPWEEVGQYVEPDTDDDGDQFPVRETAPLPM